MEGRIYINGAWLGEDLVSIEVYNPATGQKIGKVPCAGGKETRLAIEAAYRAFPAWSGLTANKRAAYLKELSRIMLERTEELANLITLEMGKPLKESWGEVAYAASFFEWFAEEGKRLYGETIPASHAHKRLMVLKQPVGVVAAITPWNFPASMITRKMAPALASGCTFVVKPSELTPFTAMKLFEFCHEAGIPAGVVNLVMGHPAPIGEEMMNNSKVRKITFTSSTHVGKALIRQGADQVKKMSLELGGHAPIIVLDDADLDKAVQGAMESKFRNAGQTCICGNRIYVHAGIHEAFVQRLATEAAKLLVGNGMDEGVDIGPLINKSAYEKVHRHVTDAIQRGAVCVLGGSGIEKDGAYFYKPTILTQASESMQVMNEETFGPVAPIQIVHSDEEAVKLANDSPYGLAAYVFSESMSRGWKVVEALEFGIVGWNDGVPSTAQAPFGGMKESGIGREGGHQGIEGFLETKFVSIGM